jgi:hypothetical protein
MTGWHLPGTPTTIEARQSQLAMVHTAHILMPKMQKAQHQARSTPATSNGFLTLSDQKILDIARRAKNNTKFEALLNGDTAGYDTPSEADEALLCQLAFYTRDPDQLDRLFRSSRLCDDKWIKRQDYRDRSIARALAKVTDHYDPDAYIAEQTAFKRHGMQQAHDHRNGTGAPAPSRPKAHPVVIAMETVTARSIDWLWYPYLALGKLCILDGDPGVGKSLFATQLAANVSQGHPMPDQQGQMTLSCGDPGIVVFIATEDDLEDTVKPRLEKAGADCSKVKVFNEWEDGKGTIQTFTLAVLPYLETVLQTYRPRLVYIDAIQAVLGGKVDANSANQLKQLLDPLAKLAATYRCAILASRHPAKPGQNNAKLIHRGANSMAIIGTARLGLFAEDHPTDKTKVLLVQSKSNAGSIGRTQIFSKKDGKFEWAGVSRISKEDLAGPSRGPDPRAFLEAYFWLEQRLEGNLAWNASDIEQEATDEQELSAHMLKRAKKALGVISAKGTDKDAGWTWRLPPLPVCTPPASSSSTTTASSHSSTSLGKSTTCGHGASPHREGVAQGEVVKEVEEVEEDAVHGPGCIHEHVNDDGVCNDCGIPV